MSKWLPALMSALALVACASPPPPPPPPPPAPVGPPPDARLLATRTVYGELPGWEASDHNAVLAAFLKSCPRFEAMPADQPLGFGSLGWVRDWRAACEEGALVQAGFGEGAQAFFEETFLPVRIAVASSGTGLTTAYYEPMIEARRTPYGPFDEPIIGLPADFEVVERTNPDGTKTVDRYRRMEDGTLTPYPTREEITRLADGAFAWGKLGDVIFLQIQGSGRLHFADGTVMRAAYAAHNGRPYTSIVRTMIDLGILPKNGASNEAARAWLSGASYETARAVVNKNERYVFFSAEQIPDPSIGPRGAANVPLTDHVSIAVDPTWHPYGALFYIAPQGEGAPTPRLAVAQDTGGAILGPLRADIYWGAGDQAGLDAGKIKHQARWWALVPRASYRPPEQPDIVAAR